MICLKAHWVAAILAAAFLTAGSLPADDSLRGQAIAGPTGHMGPVLKPGWADGPPRGAVAPKWVTPDSGHRNNVFYVGEPVTFKLSAAATQYEVRNYFGDLVDKGAAAASITVNVKDPCWYKLYLYGDTVVPECGDSVGTTTFCIFRDDPHFPKMPAASVPNEGICDEVVRAVTAMGPQRHSADASKPEKSIKDLENEIDTDVKMYVGRDPVRPRPLLIAFPGITKGYLDGVKMIAEHFKNSVEYYEPRNEPNYGSDGKSFELNEMKDFYEAIKSVDPKLKVIGPGTVSIDPGLLNGWIKPFLDADQNKHMDGFSFHAYNMVNGDPALVHKSMDALTDMLKAHDAGKMEMWQTEQGYPAALFGVFSPRRQGRWTMLQMLMYEQYGVTKEHNDLWYDTSHGYWDVPTWWENDDHGLNPAAPLMRIYSEEIFGTKFAKAYDFGDVAKNMFIGDLFASPDSAKRVAAFMTGGATDGKIALNVSGPGPLHVVSAFGLTSEVPVSNGHATLSVPEIPVYVELARGQDISITPLDFGPNLARQAGVISKESGDGLHPVNAKIPNPISKVTNGQLETANYGEDTWMDDAKPPFPSFFELDFPQPQEISRVVIYGGVPWSWRGSPEDYELQYDDNGTWKTIEHVHEDPKTFPFYSRPLRCAVDSYYSERDEFMHRFKPVTTSKIRILCHEAGYGGGSNAVFDAVLGQGPHQLQLREVEVYDK